MASFTKGPLNQLTGSLVKGTTMTYNHLTGFSFSALKRGSEVVLFWVDRKRRFGSDSEGSRKLLREAAWKSPSHPMINTYTFDTFDFDLFDDLPLSLERLLRSCCQTSSRSRKEADTFFHRLRLRTHPC